MYQYRIGPTLVPLEGPPAPEECILVLLPSEELARNPILPGLEQTLIHTPPARDARVCKAEVRRHCLCGTIVTPRHTRDQVPIAFGYLLAPSRVVLCDGTGAALSMVQRLQKEKVWK